MTLRLSLPDNQPTLEVTLAAVRFSLGVATTQEDIDYTLACLSEVMRDTQSAVRFVPCR